MRKHSIWVGFDPREADAFAVAAHSIRRHLTHPVPMYGLVLSDLQAKGLYYRPTEFKTNGDGRPQMIDVLSKRDDYDGAISTQFAISRFLVPHMARGGLALFIDTDMLARGNLARLFEQVERNPGKAIYCVQHDHQPTSATKMDGRQQTKYARKNWTSAMVFDCDHEANKGLTVELINTIPGRDLHRLAWLDDCEIGELGPEWNFLVGHTKAVVDPQLVHFTDGTPSMAGYENCEYAIEWREALNDAARGALGFGS